MTPSAAQVACQAPFSAEQPSSVTHTHRHQSQYCIIVSPYHILSPDHIVLSPCHRFISSYNISPSCHHITMANHHTAKYRPSYHHLSISAHRQSIPKPWFWSRNKSLWLRVSPNPARISFADTQRCVEPLPKPRGPAFDLMACISRLPINGPSGKHVIIASSATHTHTTHALC